MHWHWFFATLFIPILASLLALTFGQRVGAIVMLIWPLWLAWRFDNKSGTFLMLAILVYIVFFVIALLFAGLAAMATYGSVSR